MNTPPASLARRTWRLAETLLVAAMGGATFHLLQLPAGLVSGSVLAVALAALAGRPMQVPTLLTRAVLILVGIALGSVVSPETLQGFATYPASISILAVAILIMLLGTSTYLRLVHGWDSLSAVLGASPGSLSQVMALAEEMRADVRAVAVVQTMRVIVLSAGLPTALMLLGYSDPSQTGEAGDRAAAIGELAVLIPFSSLAAYLLSRVGFPGGWLFGAMLGSALLHGSGLIEAWLPLWLSSTAMITLGAVTGSRFTGTRVRDVLAFMAAGLGSTAVSMSIAALFALLCINMLSVQPADVVIAFAPGAQETMLLLALALHLDPVFVGAHHVARFLLVSLTIPLVVQRTKT